MRAVHGYHRGSLRRPLRSSAPPLHVRSAPNENADARNKDWLESQAAQMEKISAATNSGKGKFTIEIRAINPHGFEEHKKTLSDLAETDLIDRLEDVGDDWPIYTLLVPTEGGEICDADDPGGVAPASSDDKEEDIQHKKKKKKKN